MFYHGQNESTASLPILLIGGLFPEDEKTGCHYTLWGAVRVGGDGLHHILCSYMYLTFQNLYQEISKEEPLEVRSLEIKTGKK